MDLPSSLELKQTLYGGKGLFTKYPVLRGTSLFPRTIHAFGVSGESLQNVQSLCQCCLKRITAHPVICRQCQVASYCNVQCLKAACRLHSIECSGMSKLEKLRGKETIVIERPSSWPENYERLWPPSHAVVVARVINKGLLQESPFDRDWIHFADSANNLPPVKSKVFPQLEKYVRLLVPDKVGDEEIKQAFRVLSINAGTVTPNPMGTYIVAAYNIEYAALNHSCKPNSVIEHEKNGTTILYTIEDIEAGEEVTISYVMRDYYLNIRKLRRAKLAECFGLDCLCSMCEGETVVGSKFWQLEAQKSSLIAPWSPLVAQQMMVDAWSALCECSNMPNNSPKNVVKILKPAVEVQKRVLDQCNAMLILTAVTLFLNYCMLDKSRAAVKVYCNVLGDIGLRSFLEYTNKRDFTDVTGNLCIRFLDLNMMREFHEMFQVTQLFHPLRPSTERLCELLQLDEEDITTDSNWFDKEFKRECAHWSRSRGIPRVLAETVLKEFASRFTRRPSLAQLIELTQNMALPKDIKF